MINCIRIEFKKFILLSESDIFTRSSPIYNVLYTEQKGFELKHCAQVTNKSELKRIEHKVCGLGLTRIDAIGTEFSVATTILIRIQYNAIHILSFALGTVLYTYMIA